MVSFSLRQRTSSSKTHSGVLSFESIRREAQSLEILYTPTQIG